MPTYICKCCDYETIVKQNYEKHNRTIGHIEKVKEENEFVCKHCGIIFSTASKMYYHMKSCKYKTDKPEKRMVKQITTLKSDLVSIKKTSPPKESDVSVANTDKLLDAINTINEFNANNKAVTEVTKVAQTIAEASLVNAKNTGKSMNMMKYAMVNFKDAPPLLSLDQTQVYQLLDYDQKHTNKPKDQINTDYIIPVLRYYENKVLNEFFGEFIVNYFNTEEMKDRKFWTSDVSRLSFIIMQVVNREGEREWNHDKTGKKFIDLVIDPMFDEVVKLLDEFVNNKQKWIDENFGKIYIAPSKMTYLMTVQQLAKELQLDIKYHKFTKDILKYVAPHFNFDTMRLVEEANQLEHNSKPKKVTKNNKVKI
jgi:hypothetical protein